MTVADVYSALKHSKQSGTQDLDGLDTNVLQLAAPIIGNTIELNGTDLSIINSETTVWVILKPPWEARYVTHHYKMSRKVPDGHFHVFQMTIFIFLYCLKVNSILFAMVKTIFKSEF